MKKNFGFTLIELLIVVAIIAILAAIAVPNFLEAQVRSKVSRAKADMRTIATGLEAYRVDNNRYPDVPSSALPLPPIKLGINYSRRTLTLLSTPISYLTGGLLTDPFAVGSTATNFYGYASAEASSSDTALGAPSIVAATTPTGLPAATVLANVPLFLTHSWVLQSVGPDKINFALASAVDPALGASQNFGLAYNALTSDADLNSFPASSFFYDPTNGTTSTGDVVRTGKISKP
ncbi:MAG: prepilin-type N-terminal cleavage/methylation domain-containing protein [Candidatus Sumerlaeia bacterium]|nr:prepilin-type N-terminal cleavage/methylation domain-containing protein [Candidatus Sumerlaeia bacterium]